LEKRCILTGSIEAVHGCHVIDKGPNLQTFKDAFETIYGYEPTDGMEDIQNIVYLQSHIHNGPMDNQNKSLALKTRRIGFDWIERKCYIEDFFTGVIEEKPWLEGEFVNVKPEYFAWSNLTCTRRLKKYLRRIPNHGRSLLEWEHWIED